MGAQNASDEKTVREAGLKGCQRQGKKTDYRSTPKTGRILEWSALICGGGDLTERLVRSIYDSATQFLGGLVSHNPLTHRAESPCAPSARYLRCRADSGAHRGRCSDHRAPSPQLRTLQRGICPSSVLCSRLWWPRRGPRFHLASARPAGRFSRRTEGL